MKKELPKRKHPRLEDFDYSSAGAYFITICTKNMRCVLSHIESQVALREESAVGRGFTPAEQAEKGCNAFKSAPDMALSFTSVEETGVHFTQYGRIAEKQLFKLEERFACLTVDQYAIMPNHIHVIFILNGQAAGVNPRPTIKTVGGEKSSAEGVRSPKLIARPTIMDVVCAYKSLTSRECKKNGFIGQLFQVSFYEHVIRGREDYEGIVKYVCENPLRWQEDSLFTDK